MTEPESMLPSSTPPPESSRPTRRKRLRMILLITACLTVLPLAAILGFYCFISSSTFEGIVRRQLIAQLESATGGRVEIDSFHWQPLHLEADVDGLVIHGLESPGEAPYARVDRLRVRLSLLIFWSPRILLRDLEIYRPEFHFIVYPDGSTNQPHPRKRRKPGKSALDTFFNLRAGYVSVQQGVLHYENRAAAFDFQNRFIPLDFDASDVSLLVSYLPARPLKLPTFAATSSVAGPKNCGAATDKSSPAACESYRIEAGATDLSLSRGESRNHPQPVHGYMQATLDLTRSAVYLRSLRITSRTDVARGQANKSYYLEISGMLEDFTHPRWQVRLLGELDMKLLEPVFGYPSAPQGIAHLDLNTTGAAGEFSTEGSVHIDDGSYIGTGVIATGIQLDAHVRADPRQLLITSVVARLRQGGQIEGAIDLNPWLPIVPGTVQARAAADRVTPKTPIAVQCEDRNIVRLRPPPSIIPVNGKVTAQFKDVSLDTLLDMVGRKPFQRLGLNTLINGPATANWSKGDKRSVVVSAALRLDSSTQFVAYEVPASGFVDATYTQSNGAVDLRRLLLNTPASQLNAHGQLGAYPLTSPTALAVDFHSRNLNEFDAVLRDLGLKYYDKTGAAALPVSLAGQMDILHGLWTGSLTNPHIAGNLKATQLAIEMLPIHAADKDKTLPPQFIRWDSVDVTGSYSAERIDLSRGVLRRGKAEIDVNGMLIASPGASRKHAPAFDDNSQLHMRLRAAKVDLIDLLPLTGSNLPLTGSLDTQLQVDGPIHALAGSGWAEMNGGSFYGEPVARIRATGTMASQVVSLSSVTINGPAGTIAASGSFDLNSRSFQVNAHGSGIDLDRIDALRRLRLPVTGKLGFSAQGSGTLDDPRLEGHATLSSLALDGEQLGSLEFVAHTANRVVTYNATSRLSSTEINLNGQTALGDDYATQAKLEFSRFNIDALLQMAHIRGLTGESALAGTVTIKGPLARPELLMGEARLQQLAVTVAGVHLVSQGGVHASLANGRIQLDPLHITGEETDLHAQGSLSLRGKRQLDFAANGSISLMLAETLDPDLTASGTTTFQVEAHGPLANPGLSGRIDIQNASLSLEDIPNGLSQLHGTLEFNQNRLEVKSLTAMTGGGPLSLSGYLAYQHGIYANLSVTGKGIRIRYPQGVSSLADTTLRLQGPQSNMLLSGDVLITRFSVSPDLDIAALFAQASSVHTIEPPDAPSNHIRLDVHVTSSPQLNFQNAYAKLAGDVDLRLRGTVASPSLLGRVSITEGSAIIAGTRYELERGEVTFNNPIRIEPVIDLNATARVEDYDITLGLHGPPDRLAVTYHSDPPLPEADVVALLALGRTESQQRLYTQQQVQSVANPITDALLGGALNATVSSRVQKLFGAGSVKVDPNYIGALGNSTTRIIAEEQLGRNVTLTYATDVDTTGQQLIQAEIAVNRHLSLLVARDESGVFSMVIKATRRFR